MAALDNQGARVDENTQVKDSLLENVKRQGKLDVSWGQWATIEQLPSQDICSSTDSNPLEDVSTPFL